MSIEKYVEFIAQQVNESGTPNMEKDHIEQHLADKDINSSVNGSTVKVHSSDVEAAKKHLKAAGYSHKVVGGLNEEVELDEAIPYSLSASNSNYEHGRAKSPYKGQLEIDVTYYIKGKADYKTVKAFLDKKGINAEIGSSNGYRTALLSSRVQTREQMADRLDESEQIDEGSRTLYKQKLAVIHCRPKSNSHPDNLSKFGKFGADVDLSNDENYKKALADAHAYGKQKWGDGKYEISHVGERNDFIRAGSVEKVRKEMKKEKQLGENIITEAGGAKAKKLVDLVKAGLYKIDGLTAYRKTKSGEWVRDPNWRKDTVRNASASLSYIDEEHLDEISQDLANRYLAKAEPEAKALKAHIKKGGEYSSLAQRLLKRREAGIKRALPFDANKKNKQIAIPGKSGYGPSAAKHLARQGINSVKEEVELDEEQIDEISQGITKQIKRGLQGWGQKDLALTGNENSPSDIVKRTKSYDLETAKRLRKGMDKAPDHSPQGLQRRVIDRMLKKEEVELDEAFNLKMYKDNEEKNLHSHNALGLAQKFGTKDEVNKMKSIINRAEKQGNGLSGDESVFSYSLHKKYYPKLKEETEMSMDKYVAALDGLTDGIRTVDNEIEETFVIRNTKTGQNLFTTHSRQLAESKLNYLRKLNTENYNNLVVESSGELDEAAFAPTMRKAIAAHERGDVKNAKYHLDNARTARYVIPSTEISKNKELLDKYKELKAHYEKMNEEVELDEALGQHKKRPDRFHVLDKNGNPASLASHPTLSSAREELAKHPGGKIHQVGPRGSIKHVFEEVELDEAVNEKQIKKDLDSGMSIDAVIGKHANKRTTNTNEIRKVIQQHAWNKRMKKEEVDLDEELIDEMSALKLGSYVERSKKRVEEYPLRKDATKHMEGQSRALDRLQAKTGSKHPGLLAKLKDKFRTNKEEVELDEKLSPEAKAFMKKHFKRKFRKNYEDDMEHFNNSYADRRDMLKAGEAAKHLKKEEVELDEKQGVAEGLLDYLGRKLHVKTTNGKPNPKNAPRWATALGQTPQGAWYWLEKDGPLETPGSNRYFPLSGKIEFTGFVSKYEGKQGVVEEVELDEESDPLKIGTKVKHNTTGKTGVVTQAHNWSMNGDHRGSSYMVKWRGGRSEKEHYAHELTKLNEEVELDEGLTSTEVKRRLDTGTRNPKQAVDAARKYIDSLPPPKSRLEILNSLGKPADPNKKPGPGTLRRMARMKKEEVELSEAELERINDLLAQFDEGIEDRIEAARERARAAGKRIDEPTKKKPTSFVNKGKQYGGAAQDVPDEDENGNPVKKQPEQPAEKRGRGRPKKNKWA